MGKQYTQHFPVRLMVKDLKNTLKEQLVPRLRKGDIIVMDNLRSHKVQGVKELIE